MLAELIRANPMVSGMAAMAIGGALFATLKSAPGKLWGWIKTRILFVLEVSNNGDSQNIHRWLCEWLAENAKSRYVSACAFYGEDEQGLPRSHRKPIIAFVPRSVFFFRHNGRRFFAWESEETVQGTLTKRSTLNLYLFGDGRAAMKSLILSAYECAMGFSGKTVEVAVCDAYGSWQLADRKTSRPMSSLVLHDGIGERLLADARKFLESRAWYREMGIPWRRGYLLYGPPGNGKSSLAHALASELEMGINIVNISGFKTDAEFSQAAARIPAGNIMLVEDVDAIWKNRDAAIESGVTFSGFLNTIDGAAAKDGRILIMTTNHRESLDPALIRPGRADVHFGLENATPLMASEMLGRFFPESTTTDRRSFGSEWSGKSMAAIQAKLLDRMPSSKPFMRAVG